MHTFSSGIEVEEALRQVSGDLILTGRAVSSGATILSILQRTTSQGVCTQFIASMHVCRQTFYAAI